MYFKKFLVNFGSFLYHVHKSQQNWRSCKVNENKKLPQLDMQLVIHCLAAVTWYETRSRKNKQPKAVKWRKHVDILFKSKKRICRPNPYPLETIPIRPSSIFHSHSTHLKEWISTEYYVYRDWTHTIICFSFIIFSRFFAVSQLCLTLFSVDFLTFSLYCSHSRYPLLVLFQFDMNKSK